jgi:hypothetical protein
MGDLVASLARRALGVATVLRPRPASRFEDEPLGRVSSVPRESAPPSAPAPVDRGRDESPRTASDPLPIEPSVASPPSRDDGVDDRSAPADPGAPAERTARSRPSKPPAEPARKEESVPPAHEEGPRRPANRPAAIVPETIQPARLERPARTASHGEAAAVRVTIGRIEVRAVAPPAPPPRRKAAPAVVPLGLDEYLERRRSGGR